MSLLWRTVIAMSGTVHKPLTSLYLLRELRAGVIMMPWKNSMWDSSRTTNNMEKVSKFGDLLLSGPVTNTKAIGWKM